ncbi:MAG: TonB-dependent receptor [Gallionella sp.]|nr:TonB-dependent receptor [Gallionella sp.]MCK9353017.1 TonB-dependent receptor [Gallionella sp.]
MRAYFSVRTNADFSRYVFPMLILALCAALPMQAAARSLAPEAQDLTGLSIEELLAVEVYSASKFTQKTTEAPATVTVVTADDIRNHGHRTLADILASARGLFVTYDRNYQYVGVRGFNRPGDYNSRILLTVDGYRLNDPVYDQASIGTEFPLDVDLIERVEIVRGPGSSIYGSNAFFAVVNVITRHGGDLDGVEAAGELASFGGDKERLSYGKRYENGTEVLLSASRYRSRGQDLFFPEFNTPATNNGIASNLDGDRYHSLFGKLAHAGFTLTGAYASRTKQVPTAAFGMVFNDPAAETIDKQGYADLGYYGKLDERWDIAGHAFYGSYTFTGNYPFGPPVILNRDETEGRWGGAEVRLMGRFERHKLVLGAEYQDNFRQDQRNFDVAPYALYLDDRRSSQREGIYLQDEITLMQGVLLNAGLRYDSYSTVGVATNPRLGLIWSPQETTTLKFLYGTAFRAPNAFEQYYNDGNVTSKVSPNLKPEEITSYEFAAEHELQHNFRLTASVYQNDISNLINQITDPADGLLVFQNIGRVRTRGAEFEAERAWADEMRLRASYAWQVTRDQTTGMELENSPNHLVKLNYSQPVWGDALRAGMELQYTGPRKTVGGASTGGYTVANLTLLHGKLARGLELSAGIYNLLDKRYADPARPEHAPIDAIALDGRSFRLKLGYRF